MKKILIYGDSNVWGDNFITGQRIPDENQWPTILQLAVKEKFKILQEGLPGRIAGNEEEKKFKNGQETFLTIFRTNAPVDIIIIALGTNDLQIKYNKNAKKICEDLSRYKEIIKSEFNDLENRRKYFNNKLPKFIYILPPNFDYEHNAKTVFNIQSEEIRQEILETFPQTDIENEYIILEDISLFEDGIHFDYTGHQQVANLVERIISKYE